MTETPEMPPGEPTDEMTGAPPGRHGRRGLAIGAGATVLAVAAGAAVWATTTLSGGGRQPDELVPKSAFAYVKVDLDPAANQKLAAREFLGKFPNLKADGGDDDNLFDNVLSEFVDGDTIEYRTDVKPWFDKRAGFAVFPGPDDPYFVAVFRSKDDAKAKASLDQAVAEAKQEDEDVAYRITKGYVVIGEEAAVAAAVEQAERESLRDNETYRADVERLAGDQVAIAWANLGQVYDAVTGEMPFGDFVPPGLANQIKGRLVAGVHLTGDYVEVQGRALGADTKALPKSGDLALLKSLPADTAAAVALTGVADGIKNSAATGIDPGSLLEPYLEGSGLSAEDDVLPLLGNETVLAAGSSPGMESFRLGLLSTVADVDAARRGVAKIVPLLQFLGIEVGTDVERNTVVLATPPDYATELVKGGGGLGASPKFTKAVGDLTGASAAAYLDVKALPQAFPDTFTPNALTSAGLAVGVDGAEGWFRLRVVAE